MYMMWLDISPFIQNCFTPISFVYAKDNRRARERRKEWWKIYEKNGNWYLFSFRKNGAYDGRTMECAIINTFGTHTHCTAHIGTQHTVWASYINTKCQLDKRFRRFSIAISSFFFRWKQSIAETATNRYRNNNGNSQMVPEAKKHSFLSILLLSNWADAIMRRDDTHNAMLRTWTFLMNDERWAHQCRRWWWRHSSDCW